MINFGYSISPSSVEDLDKMDNTLFNKLIEIEPDVLKCIGCGSCAASCTAGNYTTMNLRKTILLLSRGLEHEVLPQLKSCMLCGKCLLVCPRGINTRHLIISICKTYKITKQ
jgi:heterodisulfide reductase subunit C